MYPFAQENKYTDFHMATSFIETVFHLFIYLSIYLSYLFATGDAIWWIYFTVELNAEPLCGSSGMWK